LFIHFQLKDGNQKANTQITYCTNFVLLLTAAKYFLAREDLKEKAVVFLKNMTFDELQKNKIIVCFINMYRAKICFLDSRASQRLAKFCK